MGMFIILKERERERKVIGDDIYLFTFIFVYEEIGWKY